MLQGGESQTLFQGHCAPYAPQHYSSQKGFNQQYETPSKPLDIQNLNRPQRNSQPNIYQTDSNREPSNGSICQALLKVSGASQQLFSIGRRISLSHRNSSQPTRNITQTPPQNRSQAQNKIFQHISVQLSNKKLGQKVLEDQKQDIQQLISQRQQQKQPQQFKVKTILPQNNYDFGELFSLQVNHTNCSLVLKNSAQVIPVVVSLKCLDQVIEQSSVDIICIVDIAQGRVQTEQKIKDVKLALLSLIELMEDNMRLQIISYHSESSIFTRLMRCSKQNKLELLRSTQSILPAKSSNLVYDMTLALQQLKMRKQKNQTSSIFLISDTYEQNCLNRVQRYFQEHSNKDDEFVINTFGIGIDHDPIVLSGISDLTNGHYHFVQNQQELENGFAKIIGGLTSVVAKNAKINLKVNETLQNYAKIRHVYGDRWTNNEGTLQKQIQYLSAGCKVDFVLELEILDLSQNNRNSPILNIVDVSVELMDVSNLNTIVLQGISSNPSSQNTQIHFQNGDINFHHQRVKAAQCIKEAREACQNHQFIQAQKKLKQLKQQVCLNQLSPGAMALISELSNQINLCDKDKFYIYGQKLMLEIYYQLMNQTQTNSICDIFLDKLKIK